MNRSTLLIPLCFALAFCTSACARKNRSYGQDQPSASDAQTPGSKSAPAESPKAPDASIPRDAERIEQKHTAPEDPEAKLQVECPEGSYISVISTYDDGRIAEQGCYGQSRSGSIVPTGTWMSYYADGKAKEIKRYQDGVAEGLWKKWDSGGRPTFQARYKGGKPVGEASLLRDGKTWLQVRYLEGKPSYVLYREQSVELTLQKNDSSQSIGLAIAGTQRSTVYSATRESERDTVTAGEPSAFFLNLSDAFVGSFVRESAGFGAKIDSSLTSEQTGKKAKQMILEGEIKVEPSEISILFARHLEGLVQSSFSLSE